MSEYAMKFTLGGLTSGFLEAAENHKDEKLHKMVNSTNGKFTLGVFLEQDGTRRYELYYNKRTFIAHKRSQVIDKLAEYQVKE